MSTTHNLLVELFVEELPPKVLKMLGEAFGASLLAGLREQRLAGEHSAFNAFASPRRLAAHISHVLAVAPDQNETVKVMPVRVAFDAQGRLTPPAVKKLTGLGAGPDDLSRIERDFAERRIDSEHLSFSKLRPGAMLAAGLQRALEEALAKLPIPKVMEYQLADGWTSVHFVRPAHGLVALHGADVVPVSALGLEAGRDTRGHRFEAAVEPVRLQHADHYARQLAEQGAVIASFAERRGELRRELHAAAAREGLRPIDDEALVDEVTALVERPNVLLCRFEPEFLVVPQECLILTMKANQKYFPLLDGAGRLTEKFLVVSNIRPADPRRVIEGNERVVRPRLADAKFFFDQDRKKTLESRVPLLARVVYQSKLGSQGERVDRVRAIARDIGRRLGGAALAAQADRAALLAKADLLTDMVGEFPELQGVMGGYYARHDGEAEAVAQAIEDHYRPRFAGDELPRGEVGVVVALADKLETLAGLFGIGQAPTGDKDPFALRRHALGVVRLLIERDLPLQTAALLNLATGAFEGVAPAANTDIELFLRDRMTVMFRERGFSADEVAAVLDQGLPAEIWLVPRRLAAVRAFASLPEAPALAAANKRVGNILKKSEGVAAVATDAALLIEPAEIALAAALESVAPLADASFDAGDYTASLQTLAGLKAPVDSFFDTVMVNVDDPALRRNRLALLAGLHATMNRVADLSRLAG